MTSLPPELKYLMEPFEQGLPAIYPNLIFQLFHDCRFIDFQTGHFATLSSSKLIVILLIWASQNWPYFIVTAFGQEKVILGSLGKTLKNNPNPVWQKFMNHALGSGTSHLQWFNQQESENGFPI